MWTGREEFGIGTGSTFTFWDSLYGTYGTYGIHDVICRMVYVSYEGEFMLFDSNYYKLSQYSHKTLGSSHALLALH